MPNYEYKCEQCGEVIESYQSITAKKLETHRQADPTTNCEGTVVRLIGRGSGFNLKGEGFYKPGWNK